jgi:hypothetical protein
VQKFLGYPEELLCRQHVRRKVQIGQRKPIFILDTLSRLSKLRNVKIVITLVVQNHYILRYHEVHSVQYTIIITAGMLLHENRGVNWGLTL